MPRPAGAGPTWPTRCYRPCGSAASATPTSPPCWSTTRGGSSRAGTPTDADGDADADRAVTLLQTELLARLARQWPDGVAWRNLADGSALTLGAWHRASNRLAHGLTER